MIRKYEENLRQRKISAKEFVEKSAVRSELFNFSIIEKGNVSDGEEEPEEDENVISKIRDLTSQLASNNVRESVLRVCNLESPTTPSRRRPADSVIESTPKRRLIATPATQPRRL